MNIYRVTDAPAAAPHFVISLRQAGYTAYLEEDGNLLLLVTDCDNVGYGFQYIGRR